MTVNSQVRGCFSSIKSAEAMLSILSVQTVNDESKEAFLHAQTILSEVKIDLEKQLMFLSREEPQYKP